MSGASGAGGLTSNFEVRTSKLELAKPSQRGSGGTKSPGQKIDAHQHFWRYNPAEYGWIGGAMAPLQRDFLPQDAARVMSAAGFRAGVAVQVRQTLEETRWLLALADVEPGIGGVVGWVDLQADDVHEQLAGFAGHRKLVGIRHIVQDEADDRFLLRPAFCRGIALLADFDLAYDILIYPRHLQSAIEFVARFPQQRFVLDHLAKPKIRTGEIDGWARDLERLASFPYVYGKLSGLVTEADWTRWTSAEIGPYLDVAWQCFGAHRLMIGSDWPVCTVAASYERTMAVVLDYLADRPAAERDDVLGSTARRFWKLTIDEEEAHS